MGNLLQNYAVVMGDLVRSEDSAAVELLHQGFNAAIISANDKHEPGLASPLTITLGDEFQGLTTSLARAAAIMRDVRFALMEDGIDCRFAIGVVQLKTPLNSERAWNMMGPGLARTREMLGEKRALSLYRFATGDRSATEALLDAVGAGLTAIERRWTGRQRDDVLASMRGETITDIAQRRGVTVHSVYKVRAAGDFDVYQSMWQAIEAALTDLDRQHGLARC